MRPAGNSPAPTFQEIWVHIIDAPPPPAGHAGRAAGGAKRVKPPNPGGWSIVWRNRATDVISGYPKSVSHSVSFCSGKVGKMLTTD